MSKSSELLCECGKPAVWKVIFLGKTAEVNSSKILACKVHLSQEMWNTNGLSFIVRRL